MHMRVEHVGDLHVLLPCKRQVCLDVVLARIDHGAFPQAAAPKEVGSTAGFEIVVGPKNHRSIPPSRLVSSLSIGSPAAFHSGKPSRSRRARRPFARSTSTARSAYTQYGPRQYATYSL